MIAVAEPRTVVGREEDEGLSLQVVPSDRREDLAHPHRLGDGRPLGDRRTRRDGDEIVDAGDEARMDRRAIFGLRSEQPRQARDPATPLSVLPPGAPTDEGPT